MAEEERDRLDAEEEAAQEESPPEDAALEEEEEKGAPAKGRQIRSCPEQLPKFVRQNWVQSTKL